MLYTSMHNYVIYTFAGVLDFAYLHQFIVGFIVIIYNTASLISNSFFNFVIYTMNKRLSCRKLIH